MGALGWDLRPLCPPLTKGGNPPPGLGPAGTPQDWDLSLGTPELPEVDAELGPPQDWDPPRIGTPKVAPLGWDPPILGP